MIRILALVSALFFGAASSQFPEFAQQYRQRLGGAIDALEQVLSDFARDAQSVGLSVPEAVQHMRSSDDPLVSRRGESMGAVLVRLEALQDQKKEMADAGAFRRVALVVSDLDAPLAQATLRDFEPAVPVTVEGLASALAGGMVGVFLVLSGRGTWRVARRRSRNKTTA